MDGVEGFEPPNIGTKNRGLTAWRSPNRQFASTGYEPDELPNCSIPRHDFENQLLSKAEIIDKKEEFVKTPLQKRGILTNSPA